MTVIGDKLKQAGVDTLGVEFYARAIEALKAHKSVRDAWRGLGERWGHAVLTRIWADMQGPAKEQSKSGDHATADTHYANVFRDEASGGHAIVDAQQRSAAARSTPTPAKKAKEFFKQKGATEAQKLITRQAALTGSSLWAELHMERLRYRELDAFIREQIIAGGNHARKAHWQTKRAAVAWLVKQHGIPADPNALVRDCVTAKEAAKFAAMADSQASLIVSKLVQQTAHEIETGVKLIAAE